MLCHAVRLFWVRSVDFMKWIHLSYCTAVSCTMIDSPSSMVSSLKVFFLIYSGIYHTEVLFRLLNQVYNLFDSHELYISKLISLLV